MKTDIFKKNEEENVEVPEIKAEVETKPEKKQEEKPVDPTEKILEKAIKETAKVENSKDYTVICARLNVRKGPSDRDDILKTVASGTTLTVDLSGTRGAWSKVTKPVDGYVLSEFIAPVK